VITSSTSTGLMIQKTTDNFQRQRRFPDLDPPDCRRWRSIGLTGPSQWGTGDRGTLSEGVTGKGIWATRGLRSSGGSGTVCGPRRRIAEGVVVTVVWDGGVVGDQDEVRRMNANRRSVYAIST
jgi:hypothetical protein